MIVVNSPEMMQKLGERLAGLLPSGCILALQGELGTGKTTFVQGAARAFGVSESQEVTSPTFVIMRQYTTSKSETLVHIDAYRLAGPEELWDIGSDEIFSTARLSFVEWPERVEEALLRPYLKLELAHIKGGRSISLSSVGEFDSKVMSQIQNLLEEFGE